MVYAHTQFSLKLRKWWKLQCYIHATVYFRTESLWLACKGICRGVLLCAESACNQRQWFIYVIRGLRHGRSKIEKWQNSPYEVAWGLKWFWSGTHTTLWPKSASQRIFAKLANFIYLCHVLFATAKGLYFWIHYSRQFSAQKRSWQRSPKARKKCSETISLRHFSACLCLKLPS